MAGEETTNQGNNINPEYNLGRLGLNMDQSVNQIPKGTLSYALNAAVENFDANSVNYQNEPGNEFCLNFPTGYHLIGEHFINEKSKHVFFLANPDSEESEIGYMDNTDCVYRTFVNAKCLNFNIKNPIHKVVHKISNCTTEIYWTDGLNPRRYVDLEDITKIYTVTPGTDVCDNQRLPIIDCNKFKIQPNFEIPELSIVDVRNGGDLTAGTYQFAIQYCDSLGTGYTSYYSVTNPTPIFDPNKVTLDFNYQVGKSIVVNINNIDITGYFQFFNVAVIKTVNNISSVELVGTYFIDRVTKEIIYTGQNVTQIRLTVDDIFEKFPYYDVAQDITAVQDILVWDNLTSAERINYQQIANRITLQWQSYRIPNTETYADELNATNLRGYMRDEVYAFEIVFLLRNGKQTDGFHIPGRAVNPQDLVLIDETNQDFIGEPETTVGNLGYSPYWKIYNTAYKVADAPGKTGLSSYKGDWEYGEFAYWESTETYPCNEEVWGDLSNQPIRHHKFPDVLVSPIFESPTIAIDGNGKYAPVTQKDAIYPLGVKLDVAQVLTLIQQSNLTDDQKAEIVAFKIVRGDRGTNKSVIAKGILRNVGKYNREGTDYYYPNYPYNDLRPDPFINDASNAYTTAFISGLNASIICRSFTITAKTDSVIEYQSCATTLTDTIEVKAGEVKEVCSFDFPKPKIISGQAFITCNTYKRYSIYAQGGEFNITWPHIPGVNNWPYFRPIGTNQADPDNYPYGAPPLGYSSWELYCIDNPGNTACASCLNPNATWNPGWPTQFWYSHYCGRYDGRDCGYTWYVDSIVPPVWNGVGDNSFIIKEVASFDKGNCTPNPLDGFKFPEAAYRLVFNSPETSFGQPFLGNILRLENVMYGAGHAHFVQVKGNANYKLLTAEAQGDALDSSLNLANITGTFDPAAMFVAYQSYLTIYVNGITRRNYAYSFNSIAGYDYSSIIANGLGVKQREIDLTQYLIPVVQNVGDDHSINNWYRESSVYIKTNSNTDTYDVPYIVYEICNNSIFPLNNLRVQITDPATGVTTVTIPGASTCINYNSTTYPVRISGPTTYTITALGNGVQPVALTRSALPFPSNTPSLSPGGVSLIEDDTRFILSDATRGGDCNKPQKELDTKVVAYYASMKNDFVNQWGQMYSYDTIDTGFQRNIDLQKALNPYAQGTVTVFGGDTFINKFAFKTKLPFFIDNRVNAPDDSDIFYDEIGNVAYPTYWHSARSVLGNYFAGDVVGTSDVDMTNMISIKAHNFDCPNSQTPKANNPGRTYYDGKFYLFAYGVPSFYCESVVNVDLRQAFNNREGEFWPHVSTSIPDDWFQENFVTIAQDNTYYYNVTFSKQNRENYFSHLPVDWEKKLCYTYYPFRAIYSDMQIDIVTNQTNNWLIYRPVSYFDFPQNYGKLTSLDGVQNKEILARFENKTLLYNQLITIDTSNPKAAYIGNSKLFEGAPPVDFADTDLGYIGCQNKMLLKIPQGQVTVDAKRGQIFLLTGQGAKDLSAFGSGLNRFFTDHLAFEILRYFPEVDTDNHFNGIGLHGVYDSKYDRIIITKLDYIPVAGKGVMFDAINNKFYVERILGNATIIDEVFVTDYEYFCNKSWSLSFNFNTNSWISFHSYIPNWYVAENNFFYSGLNGGCDLAAIAYEEVAYTTSSTTTPCIGCKPPEPTTTTTTTYIDCDLEGTAILEPEPTTTTTSSSSTSTSTSTSTTTITTTLCPTCSTYTVVNSTVTSQPVTITSCYTNNEFVIYVNANSFINVCSCIPPEVTIGVTQSLLVDGECVGCFCYTITNNTGKDSDFSYTTCNGVDLTLSILNGQSLQVCAQQFSVTSFFPLTIEGGMLPCSVDGDCIPIPTTTTTSSSSTSTTTSTSTSTSTSTTTSTTTVGPINVPLCAVLYNDTDGLVYYYNLITDTSTLLPVPATSSMYNLDIAHTQNKLWTLSTNKLLEWDITLTPFTAVYNRNITLPHIVGVGLGAINDTTLISVNPLTTPQSVVTLDISITPATSTYKFDMIANRTVAGDILLTTNNKVLILTGSYIDGSQYITQYDYLTGSVEVDIQVSPTINNPFGLFEDSGDIYIMETFPPGNVYKIDLTPPYGLTSMGSTISYVNGASQLPSCLTVSFEATTTTSTTIPPTTTTTTTVQNFAKCVDCSPVLSSVTDNGVGLLSVGNMISGACALGNYVIDWYLDSTSGPIEFTSGNTGNTDPAIQQFHPFTGSAARPSKGGSWIPVIRYAVLDGIKYTSTITPGESYASDLATCLTPITVLNLDCANGTNTTVGFEQYSHRFAYVNGVQVASDASKSLVFTLNSDGSTQYFAWFFSGANISDRITFTYVSPTNVTSTVLQDYVVGFDLPNTDFTTTPKKVDASSFRYIIDLTGITYALGDYILIDVVANYLTVTPNTNWTVYFKCLTTFDTSWTRAVVDPCSAVMTYNAGLCRYELTYGFTTFDDNKNTDIYKYLSSSENAISPAPTNSLPIVTGYFSNGLQSCSANQYYYNPSCIPMVGSYTYNKVGPNITFTFTDATDYNKYQTDYNNAIAAVTPVGPTPATSDINYYRFIRMFLQKFNSDSCGDTASINTNIVFHYLTSVTFDSVAKTMSFTIPYVDGTPFFSIVGACAGTCSTLDYLNANNSLATSVWSQTYTAATTQTYSSNGVYYVRTAPVTNTTTVYRNITSWAPDYPTTLIPTGAGTGWYTITTPAIAKYNIYYDYRDLITITDMSDGVNNFKIESYLDVNGVYALGNIHTIYEISGGVVTTPSAGCP